MRLRVQTKLQSATPGQMQQLQGDFPLLSPGLQQFLATPPGGAPPQGYTLPGNVGQAMANVGRTGSFQQPQMPQEQVVPPVGVP